jgi:hypothetical protein
MTSETERRRTGIRLMGGTYPVRLTEDEIAMLTRLLRYEALDTLNPARVLLAKLLLEKLDRAI